MNPYSRDYPGVLTLMLLDQASPALRQLINYADPPIGDSATVNLCHTEVVHGTDVALELFYAMRARREKKINENYRNAWQNKEYMRATATVFTEDLERLT